uniref:Uncharacterized protein n=1 Tax=Sphaeramia orbicularis TaxID=375764 RepID=A0A673C476_9TELE
FYSFSLCLISVFDRIPVDPVVSLLKIEQQPLNLLTKPEQEVHLHCYHGDTNFPYMLWYQQCTVFLRGEHTVVQLLWLLYKKVLPEEKSAPASNTMTVVVQCIICYRTKYTNLSMHQKNLYVVSFVCLDYTGWGSKIYNEHLVVFSQ